MADGTGDFSERLLQFGSEVAKMTIKLNKTPAGRHIETQLIRSATCCGANYRPPLMILQFASLILYFAIIFVLGGCSYVSMPWSSDEVQSDPTAEALFNEGMEYLKNKKYVRAIDRFERVKTEFPFAPQVIPAELKIAEAYYLDKEYPQAAAAFKEFQALHPTNENIPFVVYHLGLVHFEQFTSIDRDQKMTEIAKGHFETVLRNYPNSPYAGKAREKLAQCLEYLAEHEFDIASFYLRQQKYPAARDRFEEILRRYPHIPTAVKSLYQLGESYRLDKNNVKAALAYEALIQHYPESPLAEKARTQLGKLEKEKHDPLAMLLKRDGRPAYNPLLIASGQGSAGDSQQGKERKLNLVAKKEVVHEEPGDEKGMFSRVIDTLNPFSSSSEKEKSAKAKEEKEKKKKESLEESGGFFSSLWGGSSSDEKIKAKAQQDPSFIANVDESLKEKGVSAHTGAQAPKPPAPDLPQLPEEPTLTPAERAAFLGKIDATLQANGKQANELPPLPEIAPALLRTSTPDSVKQVTTKSELTPSPASRKMMTDIDKALKQKGIEPPKVELPPSPSEAKAGPQGSSRQEPEIKVELSPRLSTEKKPYLLDSGEFRVQEGDIKDAEEKTAKKGTEEKDKSQVQKSAEPLKELPQAVVKGPPQPVKQKLVEVTNPDEEEEEEGKGVFDQLKESMQGLGTILNPFGW